jgi:hypothetical protein
MPEEPWFSVVFGEYILGMLVVRRGGKLKVSGPGPPFSAIYRIHVY